MAPRIVDIASPPTERREIPIRRHNQSQQLNERPRLQPEKTNHVLQLPYKDSCLVYSFFCSCCDEQMSLILSLENRSSTDAKQESYYM